MFHDWSDFDAVRPPKRIGRVFPAADRPPLPQMPPRWLDVRTGTYSYYLLSSSLRI